MHLTPEMTQGMTEAQRLFVERLNCEVMILRAQVRGRGEKPDDVCKKEPNIRYNPGCEHEGDDAEIVGLKALLRQACETRDALRGALKSMKVAVRKIIELTDLDSIETTRTWMWFGEYVEAFIALREAEHQAAQVE